MDGEVAVGLPGSLWAGLALSSAGPAPLVRADDLTPRGGGWFPLRLMKPAHRPKSVVRRYLAALTLFVLGFWVQGLHSALESHEVCEHGELVHKTLAPEAALEEWHGPCVSDLGEHESEHHHCGIATAAPQAEPPQAPLTFAAVLSVAQRASLSRGAPRADSIPRFLLAPHHSPPFFVS